jgi:predicted nuclease with RNAse H fold
VSRVVGVDLSASPAGTAVAVLDGASISSVLLGADDDEVVAACSGADKVGIDCPLGWPISFVDFVSAHAGFRATASAGTVAERSALAYRVTDRWVAAHFPPLRPLSVAADRIGHAALRCAGLLTELGVKDRSGCGLVVEVYPAGSLLVWGLPYRRYKESTGREVRSRIVDELGAYVDLGAAEAVCRSSDHVLDAVVAAISARAALLGMATLPDVEQFDVARVEGWIAIPTRGLAEVATT